jgi:hypothetical protein
MPAGPAPAGAGYNGAVLPRHGKRVSSGELHAGHLRVGGQVGGQQGNAGDGHRRAGPAYWPCPPQAADGIAAARWFPGRNDQHSVIAHAARTRRRLLGKPAARSGPHGDMTCGGSRLRPWPDAAGRIGSCSCQEVFIGEVEPVDRVVGCGGPVDQLLGHVAGDTEASYRCGCLDLLALRGRQSRAGGELVQVRRGEHAQAALAAVTGSRVRCGVRHEDFPSVRPGGRCQPDGELPTRPGRLPAAREPQQLQDQVDAVAELQPGEPQRRGLVGCGSRLQAPGPSTCSRTRSRVSAIARSMVPANRRT